MATTRREGPLPVKREVFLLRHAKSAWDDAEMADFQRPLAPRGERAARAMGQHLAQARVRPGVILCSGAVRAQQTLAAVEAGLGGAEVVVDDALYLLGAEGLFDRLRRIGDAVGSVMIVGHNPGMHELALTLVGDAADEPEVRRLRGGYPAGALATLEWERTHWRDLAPGCCRLRGFVRPKDL